MVRRQRVVSSPMAFDEAIPKASVSPPDSSLRTISHFASPEADGTSIGIGKHLRSRSSFGKISVGQLVAAGLIAIILIVTAIEFLGDSVILAMVAGMSAVMAVRLAATGRCSSCGVCVAPGAAFTFGAKDEKNE